MTKQEEQRQQHTHSAYGHDNTDTTEPIRKSLVQTAIDVSPDDITDKKAIEKYRKMPPISPEMRRRQFLIGGLGIAATLAGLGVWLWNETPHPSSNPSQKAMGDQLVLQWNYMALQALGDSKMIVPAAARALAIVHTCMYDAWAAYDSTAVSTQLPASLRRPSDEHTLANKSQAISFAAYRALVDLFPGSVTRFNRLMTQLGYNAANHTSDASTPAGIGNLAAKAVLTFRHQDGSNQLGNLHPGTYSDYTKYQAVNTPTQLKDPNHWQPLEVPIPTSLVKFTIQTFDGAQWANVTPFAPTIAHQFMPKGPVLASSTLYQQQAQEVLQYSAGLTDEHKVIAEYWSYNPALEQPSGQWSLLAQLTAQRDKQSLDQNVKMFFALGNALLDASIAVWTTKRAYDSPYPVTVIRQLFQGKQIQVWAGPDKGIQSINGAYWQPYQPDNLIAPPYPEYCSEHSAFSAAAATILRNFTGSDRCGITYTFQARSSQIEQGTPAKNIVLEWRTFSAAADQAGLAQRYSGTHFAQGDLDGRTLGKQVGQQTWQKATSYFNGK